MNDVFLTFFIVVSFIFAVLYVRKSHMRYLILTSAFLGFSAAAKWTGLYAIAVIFLYILFAHLRGVFSSTTGLHLGGVKILSRLSSLILIPVVIYLASYGQFWLQGHSVKQFVDLHKQIWWYQNRNDLKHPYGTTPLFCVPEGLAGPKTFCPWILDTRPVYFSYEDYGQKAGYIYALGNPLIFWPGILAVSFLIGRYFEERKKEYALVLLGYFVFWLPWIFSPRILFLHHYLPSIPFLSISLGFALTKMWQSNKFLVIVTAGLIALTFAYFYPITSGYPIAREAIDRYMWLGSWR